MGALRGLVFNLQRFSFHDGPGIRTTVFLKGCPLRCWWCHNPEGQSPEPDLLLRPERCIGCGACLSACPYGAIAVDGAGTLRTDRSRCHHCGACVEVCYAGARELAGRWMTVEEVIAEVERDIPFYGASEGGERGGVTFSGGEPLSQPDFLHALLVACRARGLHTAVDTSGFAPWPVLDRIRGLVDLFLYDLKVVDDARHRRYTGVSNRRILENLRRLSAAGHRIFLRIPLIPGVNDDPEAVHQALAFAATLPRIDRVDLLPYHATGLGKYERLDIPYALHETRPPSDERVAEIARAWERAGFAVKIRG